MFDKKQYKVVFNAAMSDVPKEFYDQGKCLDPKKVQLNTG